MNDTLGNVDLREVADRTAALARNKSRVKLADCCLGDLSNAFGPLPEFFG